MRAIQPLLAAKHSIQGQFLGMAVITAVLSSLFVIIVATLVLYRPGRDYYRMVMDRVLLAYIGKTPLESTFSAGYGERQEGYLVASDGQIRQVFGNTACNVGESIQRCIPHAARIPSAGALTGNNGQTWYEFRHFLPDGSVILARIQPVSDWRMLSFYGVPLLQEMALALLGSLLIAPLLSLFTVRPLARRLQRIAAASRAFVAGELSARIGDGAKDEIGQLGQQFDQLVEAVSAQVQALRQLARQNSELALAAEQNARSAERIALSRDLHDTISQHLFSLAMGTANLAGVIERSPKQAARQAEQLAVIAAHAQSELRNLLSWLHTHTLEEGDISELLNRLIETWRAHNSGAVHLHIYRSVTPLPLVVQHVLYRICQEGLNNIARHAGAEQVTVTLIQDEEAVSLLIADDGYGFDPTSYEPGLGLIGMQERVRALGGTLVINSAEGSGTVLRVRLPLAQQEEQENHADYRSAR